MNEKADQKDNDDLDVFAHVEQGFKTIQDSIQRSTPAYMQSMSNLQNQVFAAWKNSINSTISIQHMYAEKAGLNTQSVELTAQIIQRMAEESSRTFEMQGMLMRGFLDSSEQHLKRFNENILICAQWQKKLVSYSAKIN